MTNMQTMQIDVENIRCGGCANTISRKLLEDERLTHVDVDVANQRIIATGPAEAREQAVIVLEKLGYPEQGKITGMGAAARKARALVSCAIGKVTPTVSARSKP